MAHSGVRRSKFREEFQILKEVDGAGGSPRALGICSKPSAILCSFVGRNTLEHVLEKMHYSDTQLLGLALRLCIAVQEVHEKDFIHNDLMDDNIVVDVTTGRVSIIDYGNACRPGDNVGYGSSSADNIAPEILGGGPSTSASDVFAVGFMLE